MQDVNCSCVVNTPEAKGKIGKMVKIRAENVGTKVEKYCPCTETQHYCTVTVRNTYQFQVAVGSNFGLKGGAAEQNIAPKWASAGECTCECTIEGCCPGGEK